MKRILYIFALFVSFVAVSQDSTPKLGTRSGHEIGYAQGAGLGFFYRYVKHDVGVQATIFPFLAGQTYFINSSIHALIKIGEKPYGDFMLAIGSNFSFIPQDFAMSPQFGFLLKFKYPKTNFIWDVGLMATAIFYENQIVTLFPLPSFSLGYRF